MPLQSPDDYYLALNSRRNHKEACEHLVLRCEIVCRLTPD